ncbi:MAG: hypothetical protein LBL15_00385 [Oscillospiraceae bacterium]|jgi:transcription elongation factor Elf1|nr:hypothetical protein [Oscillospiraceae bacterium]
MTESEAVFLRSAVSASGGRDGNFSFTCPSCGGYCIGVRKSRFDLIIAHCSGCGLHVREKTIEKGA